MKRSFGLIFGSATLFLAALCVGAMQYAAGSSALVSDQEASLLYGGACEDGYKYVKDDPNSCSDLYRSNWPYYGCSWKQGWKSETSGGSWLPDGRENCGVSECGDVLKLKKCAMPDEEEEVTLE